MGSFMQFQVYLITTSTLAKYEGMKLVSEGDYLAFRQSHDSIIIGDNKIMLQTRSGIKTLHPEGYRLEEWSVWDFLERGEWATHIGNYRGNWSPFVPRNLIEHYTHVGDTVCDPMMGSGTTHKSASWRAETPSELISILTHAWSQ